jgi:2-polyprenyl-3-methyl-5-hydroxy-6-metoxy-1,4-benzoquinol methylase
LKPSIRELTHVIERWSEGIAAESMAEEILLELVPFVERHPWWQARAELVLRLLEQLAVRPPTQILDAGCGWGVTLRALENHGYRALGLDISHRALVRLDRPGRHLVQADLAQPIDPGRPQSDAVLALDVIEHTDDDQQVVRHLGSLVKPGGVLIVSVPALPEMYSEFDAIQGHRRRYRPETLRQAIIGSELELERIFWWGRWLVPVLGRQRARPRGRPGDTESQVYRRYLKLPPRPLAWIAKIAFRLEERAAIRGQLDRGTSLFAVARRPAN